MIIDTHCHLSDDKFAGDLDAVIKRANKAGVGKMIVPSVDLEDAEKVIEIIEKYDGVYGLMGVHPENSHKVSPSLRKRETFLKNKKVVGIGEIGMDFYWDKEKKTKKQQIQLFKIQLELAIELDLPVVIHSRGAEEEIREVLDSLQGRVLKGQFHCFGESEEFLEYVLERGFYVSFGGNVTYGYSKIPPSEESDVRRTPRRSDFLRELLKEVPLERLLLETDSPYLPPEGKRGERNEPCNAIITARFIADFLNISLEELARQTNKNAQCLYQLI